MLILLSVILALIIQNNLGILMLRLFLKIVQLDYISR